MHGSVLLTSGPVSSGAKEPKVIGSLDYWFKLHTAATSRIQEWLDHREEVLKALEQASSEMAGQSALNEIDLLQGEQRSIHLPTNQEKLVGRRKKLPTPEATPAPRVPQIDVAIPKVKTSHLFSAKSVQSGRER